MTTTMQSPGRGGSAVNADDLYGPENAVDKRSWRVRCQGIARSHGGQCKRWAVRGTMFCRKHGAQLPGVKARGEMRMAELRRKPSATLADLMESDQSKLVRIRAAKAVLRLAGPLPRTLDKVDQAAVDRAIEELRHEAA